VIYGSLMRAMSPWKPHEIEQLTPLQLLCLSSEHPPGRGTIRSMEELEEAAKNEPAWDEVPT
jgi:hypothetical protein